MAGSARVWLIDPLNSGIDANGDFQVQVGYLLSDPAHGTGTPTNWESGWQPRLGAFTLSLPADSPSSHRGLIEDAVIADAAAQLPWPFTVTKNRVSVPQMSGDGDVSKYQRAVVTTGFSQTINNVIDDLVLEPAETLATGTVTLPSQPGDGQCITLATTQTITALTIAVQGSHVLAPGAGITTLTQAAPFCKWLFRSANDTWYRVG
jgi:hypothetical protein